MKELRVVLIMDGPRLYRDIFKMAIERTAGLRLVAVLYDLAGIEACLEQWKPGWVITCHSQITQPAEFLGRFLRSNPGMVAVVFSSSGEGIRLLRYTMQEEDMTGKSWSRLVRLATRDGP